MIEVLTKELLDDIYNNFTEDDCEIPYSDRYAFLSSQIFDLITYDSGLDSQFGKIIYDVLRYISCNRAFYYFSLSDENYRNYILVCNELERRHWIDWGVSIRCAFLVEEEDSTNFDNLFKGVWIKRRLEDGTWVENPVYDEEGVKYSINNLKVLLDWVGEQ